jgi:hypothetical protein
VVKTFSPLTACNDALAEILELYMTVAGIVGVLVLTDFCYRTGTACHRSKKVICLDSVCRLLKRFIPSNLALEYGMQVSDCLIIHARRAGSSPKANLFICNMHSRISLNGKFAHFVIVLVN